MQGCSCAVKDFYPRPPRGGRRLPDHRWPSSPANFYPRPPRGGRRAGAEVPAFLLYFYPRPPRGGRQHIFDSFLVFFRFLSTPSARRATRLAVDGLLILAISIHALREEGDSSGFETSGARKFLSTPSARRATAGCSFSGCYKVISIHALREEGDKRPGSRPGPVGDFYPRPPRGGRP